MSTLWFLDRPWTEIFILKLLNDSQTDPTSKSHKCINKKGKKENQCKCIASKIEGSISSDVNTTVRFINHLGV